MSYVKFTVAALWVATAALPGEVFFTDSFNRANSSDVDASTNGMSGVLVTNGTLNAANTWLEPVDAGTGLDSKSAVAANQLQVAVGAGTSHIIVNHNFASELPAGSMSVSLNVQQINPGNDATPEHRYLGVGIGFSLAEGNANTDRGLAREADLFVAVTQNGLIRINDGPEDARPVSNDVASNLTIPISGGSFTPGVLRVDLNFANPQAGTLVTYDVFFNGADVLTGTRSFVWSDTGELRVGIDGRASGSTVGDDFEISGTAIVPPPVVSLGVSPNTVVATNPAQAVTLTWTNQNLPAGATYAISASPTATFPGGNQTGSAVNGVASIPALVNGTLGDTTFTILISNNVPQLIASNSVVVTQIPEPGSQPNVIVILADDTGWSDYGSYGSFIRTPNIDSLAANGLRFREFYQAARCSPTRCSILTGLYPHQAAVDPGNPLPNLRTDNNVTIAELLSANGYRTYMSGKWHLGGPGAGRDPISRGFQHVFGQGPAGDGGNVSDAFGYWVSNNYHIISSEIPYRYYPNQFHYTDAIGDYSVDFLNHNFVTNGGDKPFFLYMSLNAPHWPVCAPAELANKYTDVGDPNPGDVDYVRYEDGWDVLRALTYSNQLALGIINSNFALSPRSDVPSGGGAIDSWNSLSLARRNDLARRMALYAAMIEQVDQNIGKVVTRLQQLGQLDNTIIFIVNDNGANYEGGEFGNSDSSTFTPWAAGDLPHMGQPQNANNSGYPRVNQGGAWANLSNTPFRLYKHFVHNGGIRTPMIVHWPRGMTNSIKGTWTEERGHLKDIMATIVAATGVTYPTNFENHPVLPLEGTSLMPTFAGQTLPARDIGQEHESNRAFFRGKWKFVTKNFALSDGSSPADELELYDMVADPSEVNNLALAEPQVLLEMIDGWNAWATRVGVPAGRLILPPLPQVDPAPLPGDLFVDTFNRANADDTDASANGMWGSLLPQLGASATYYEGFAPERTDIEASSLRLAVTSAGMSESGLMHNFIDPAIVAAGGFSVQLRVDDISGTIDADRYVGFGMGLTQSEAAAGADIGNNTPPYSFRGAAWNQVGRADFFVELDAEGNVKSWLKGVPVATNAVGVAQGTLLACFELNGFSTADTVTVTVFFNGQALDLNGNSPGKSLAFTWENNNANYLGLSARASGFTRADNLAIRTLPLTDALVSEFALRAGLTATNTAPTANPDGDRDNNLVEWLKGGNPDAADDERRLFRVAPSSAGDFRFGYIRLTDAIKAGITYTFHYSTNLTDWTPFTPEELLVQPDAPGYETVENRVPAAIAAGKDVIFILMRAEDAGS